MFHAKHLSSSSLGFLKEDFFNFHRGNEHLLPRLTLRHLKKDILDFSFKICFGASGQGG
jgi:hypothetical protein